MLKINPEVFCANSKILNKCCADRQTIRIFLVCFYLHLSLAMCIRRDTTRPQLCVGGGVGGECPESLDVKKPILVTDYTKDTM